MKPTKAVRLLFLVLTSFVLDSSASAIDVPVSSTFDSSLEGWTKDPNQTTDLVHVAVGGNPGGYIENLDQGPTGGDIIAPPSYLGDWSNLDGHGILSWDFNLFELGPTTGEIVPLRASISGPGGSATFNSGILPILGSWVPINAPLVQSAWTVNSGDWASVLADVDELRLLIEPVFSLTTPGEVTGIDNVFLGRAANGLTQVDVAYTDPAPPTGPLSLGLGALPDTIPAFFVLEGGGAGPSTFDTSDVLFAELTYGDGTWTTDDLVSFSMTVDALGAVTDLTYEMGLIDTPTAIAGPILNSSFSLTVQGTDIASGQPFNYLHQNSMQTLTLLPVPGDFDFDGDVDGHDFLSWQRGFGTDAGPGNIAPLSSGNANGDQFIDGADLAIWETQYGTGSSPLSSAAVVPEPSSLILAAIAGLIGGFRRRRI